MNTELFIKYLRTTHLDRVIVALALHDEGVDERVIERYLKTGVIDPKII